MKNIILEIPKVFPNESELADMILAEMNLPTSLEQLGRKRQAEREGTLSYMNQDLRGIKSAVVQAQIYNTINPLVDLKTLCKTERPQVEQALKKVAQKYNEHITRLINEFPQLANVAWNVFRRTFFVDECLIDSALNPTRRLNAEMEEMGKLLNKALEQQGILEKKLTTDKEFAENYIPFNQTRLPIGISQAIKLPLILRTVSHDPWYPFGLGIGRYAFTKPEEETGDIFQTPWDLRQTRIPLLRVG